MADIIITLGGKELPLRKSKREFDILFPTETELSAVNNENNVKNIHHFGSRVWRAEVFNSESLDFVMEKARIYSVIHHVYEVDDKFPQPFVPTDIINLKLKEDYSDTIITELIKKYALIPIESPHRNIICFRLTSNTGMNPLKLCNILNQEPALLYSEPDYLMFHRRLSFPETQTNYFFQQWHLHQVDDSRIHSKSHISIDGAWTITRGSKDIVLAVLDDGFDLTNPELEDFIVDPADFHQIGINAISGDLIPGDASPLAERGDYHGTPCAGLAIARNKGIVSGVAPDCSWMPVRMSFNDDSLAPGLTSEHTTLKIFQYISRRADVVSCSWGVMSTAYSFPSQVSQEVIGEIVKNGGRRGKGLVICFGAGNENLPTFIPAEQNRHGMEYYDEEGLVLGHFFKHKEIHGGWTEIPGVIVVGAVTSRNTKALYSNWGPHLVVVAPSDNFHPRSRALTRENYNCASLITTDNENNGRGLVSAGLSNKELGFVTADMGGTSGSTPIVAGVCALILSVNPFLTSDEVLKIIAETADKEDLIFQLDEREMYNNLDQNPNFDERTFHSIWFGYGKVNAEKAVKKALSLLNLRNEGEL